MVGSPVKELAASMRRKGRGMLGTGDHRWQPQASEVALGGGEEQVDRSQILKVIDFCTEEFVLYLAGNALIHYVSDLSLVLAWALGLQK